MGSKLTDRNVAIAMGIAPLAGIALSALTTDVSEWTSLAWMFVAISLLLSVMALFYAVTDRSVLGKLPTDPAALRRIKIVSIVAVAAVAFLFVTEVITGISGSWNGTDGLFLGIYGALAIMFLGRLAAIKDQESQTS